MERAELQQRIDEWQTRLMEASVKWGKVRICAVTKTVDVETVNLSFDCGIRIIGENRVQEYMQKLPLLNPEFERHLIGQLQTNKVKYIMSSVDMIQSLDRMALAEEISHRAVQENRTMQALVQVNIAREPQKSGIDEDELVDFLKKLSHMEGIRVQGLMAIMPYTDDPETVRPYFRRMRTWFDRIREMGMEHVEMETLSMGMSGDCLVAAQEGATMVRIGSGIFGRRI